MVIVLIPFSIATVNGASLYRFNSFLVVCASMCYRALSASERRSIGSLCLRLCVQLLVDIFSFFGKFLIISNFFRLIGVNLI